MSSRVANVTTTTHSGGPYLVVVVTVLIGKFSCLSTCKGSRHCVYIFLSFYRQMQMIVVISLLLSSSLAQCEWWRVCSVAGKKKKMMRRRRLWWCSACAEDTATGEMTANDTDSVVSSSFSFSSLTNFTCSFGNVCICLWRSRRHLWIHTKQQLFCSSFSW